MLCYREDDICRGLTIVYVIVIIGCGMDYRLDGDDHEKMSDWNKLQSMSMS